MEYKSTQNEKENQETNVLFKMFLTLFHLRGSVVLSEKDIHLCGNAALYLD